MASHPELAPDLAAMLDPRRLTATPPQQSSDIVQAAPKKLSDNQPAPSTLHGMTCWPAEVILQAQFAPIRWCVPGLLSEGLNILAGRPKVGKSWLAMQIATAVACGGQVLGRDANPGSVLYLALEDSPATFQERLIRQRTPLTRALTVAFEWKSATVGGITDLKLELDHNHHSLIVVDTVSRLLGGLKQRDEDAITPMYGSLQELALRNHCAILLIDHHAKPGLIARGDPIDDILGSTAKAGVADTSMGLYRDPEERGKAVLGCRGRRNEEINRSLHWDGLTCTWQDAGEVAPVAANSERGRVLAAVKELQSSEILPTCTRIAEITGMKTSSVHDALKGLVDIGALTKLPKMGREQPYGIPMEDEASYE